MTTQNNLGIQYEYFRDIQIPPPPQEIEHSDFPEDFIFGAATSAYQIEGGWTDGGKGVSNWDAFTMSNPDAIVDGSNGQVAIDHYHMFREDVKVMKKLGFKSYRFSIAWTRILPRGRISGGTCRDGINFYNSLIDELVRAGIEPCATLFHWDTPQCLEQEYGGFLDNKIVQDFREFAEICFWEFGDRVKTWITLNEPWVYCVKGYVKGAYPPNRGARPKTESEKLKLALIHRSAPTIMIKPRIQSTDKKRVPLGTFRKGNPGTEPYIVGHHLILCHAHAVDIYRKKYQESQGGKIGMTNCCIYYEPLNIDSEEDQNAARRAIDFNMGWFVEPQITGDYPESMQKNIGRDRLPEFNEAEKKLVKGSYDFIGVNNYTTNYASNNDETVASKRPSYLRDSRTHISDKRENQPIGPQAGSEWLYFYPEGIYKLMMFIKDTYNDPVIYITENGVNEQNTWLGEFRPNVEKILADRYRIHYHQGYLYHVHKAISEGAKVKAYYIWSLFDNFEWAEGYTVRFGICFADGDKARLPKDSAIWWQKFLTKRRAGIPLKDETDGSEKK